MSTSKPSLRIPTDQKLSIGPISYLWLGPSPPFIMMKWVEVCIPGGEIAGGGGIGALAVLGDGLGDL